MADSDDKMVLRTVYLPPVLDEKLRFQAFRGKVTKNDLIRKALERRLTEAATEAAAAKGVSRDAASRMVLRTVYLPPALDEALRNQAFELNGSKNDLIRRALERELAASTAAGAKPKAIRPAARRKAPAKGKAAPAKAAVG